MQVKFSAKPDGRNGPCFGGGAAPFILGLVAALVVGWVIFPKVLFSAQPQPVEFSHKVHVDGEGMECADCHYFNEDGSYNGLPTTENCADCHDDVLGETEAEIRFVEDYVHTGREVEWKVYQKQPDNVFFSHAAHNVEKCNECHDFTEPELCNQCHPAMSDNDTPPPFMENRITGYSKDTMKMWQCERCHANPDHYGVTRSSNACYVCHK